MLTSLDLEKGVNFPKGNILNVTESLKSWMDLGKLIYFVLRLKGSRRTYTGKVNKNHIKHGGLYLVGLCSIMDRAISR